MQGFFLRATQNVPASVPEQLARHCYQNPDVQPRHGRHPAAGAAGPGFGPGHARADFVYFEQGATAGFDAHFDAEKLANTTGLNLSSEAAGLRLAVNGLPPAKSAATVPLAVGVPTTGTYTLEAASLPNLGTTAVYLHDAVTGQQMDLRQQPRYCFTVGNAALITGRFTLSFGALGPLATTSAVLAGSVSVYPNPARRS